MIYTVTLNPSVDLIVELDHLELGTLNRMNNDMKVPGGKGISVSRVLRRLGMPSVATGFIGGFTGRFIDEWLRGEDIASEFIEIDDDSRINIKLLKQNETVINGKGPSVSIQEVQAFLYYMSRVGEGDIVIMSGTIPPNVDRDIYDRIIHICKANRSEFVVDAPPKRLLRHLKEGPLLIKPNLMDLSQMFNAPIKSKDDIIKYGQQTVELGAKFSIVSLGELGGILFTDEGKIYETERITGDYVNSEGSRDAMIAGFISTWIKTADAEESFRMATAAASATAFTKDLAKRDQIFKLKDSIIIKELQ
ncbi:MAG: 1-phosphofructokinase [Tissierellia bacterium]|nr:1-phosphofructokinase [Tissierellia bacterium]